MASTSPQKMALIVSQGTLDGAYPPFILASTAASMDMEVKMFFTFYGLGLLKKKIDAKVAPASNPAMPFKLPFGSKGLQNINWKIPNFLSATLPGFQWTATSLMKKAFKKKGIATIEDLRNICLDSKVTFIACTLTMEVFGFREKDFIDGIETGGAASFLDFATDADIQLFT
jgi:peroxiredoxin family protein